MDTVRVELIGGLRVTAEDGRSIDAAAFPGRQGRLAFAYLALRLRPVPREELAEVLWPEGPPRNWTRDLSALISRLKRVLRSLSMNSSSVLSSAAGCYQLRLPAGSEVDVHAVSAQAAEAARAAQEGDADRALDAALAAVEVGRGPLLAGEEAWWVSEQRVGLERARLTALDVAARALGERGDLPRALAFAAEAVEVAPFRESGYATLMRLQLDAGDRAEALRTYERCRRLLAEELGVDPAPETEAVFLAALRTHRQPLTGAGPADAVGYLPAAVTTFVGRDREIREVAAALAHARLVTLCGVGGVGKSRLALECATRLTAAYPDGVWQCELARVSRDEALAHVLAGALGVHQRSERTIEGSLVDFLRPKRALLLLDNCEHLLQALAPLLATLLRACPRLDLLATSRERLAVDGEHVLPIDPLPLPVPGADLLAGPLPAAVQLFADRAAAACHGFALGPSNAAAVSAICTRLDGLPLAVELAAARLRTVGIDELADRLDERFDLLTGGPRTATPRLRTLRGMVDWSYGLLSDGERRVFDHLSVFAGSFTAQAATAVCADSAAHIDEALADLVDRSMVVADTTQMPARYQLLETLRVYGRQRLDERREAEAARRAHAGYYATLAEALAERLCGPDEGLAAAGLEREWDELRAAHRWSTTRGEMDVALRLAAALYWYALFYMRTEAPVWAEQAVALPGADTHPLYPRACGTAGVGCWARGELGPAVAFGRRGLKAAAGQPSRRFALDVLGAAALFEGRLDASAEHFTGGAAAAADAGDDYHRTHLLGDVALVRSYQGHHVEALRAADEARRIARVTANPSAIAWSLYVDGEIVADADPDRAIVLLDASIDLARTVGSTFALGVALVSASSVRGRHGDPDRALEMFLQVVEHWHAVGNWTQQWTTLRNVIDLFVRIGADTPAAVLLSALRAADTAAPLYGSDAHRLAADARLLHSRLGAQLFSAATAQGETMTGDEVVAYTCAQLRQAAGTLAQD